MGRITRDNLPLKCENWFEKVKSFNRSHLKINPGKAALLVVDMQNYFIDSEGGAYLKNSPAIIPNVKKLITNFRKAKRPVIFTRHAHKEDGSDAGIMGWWWNDVIIDGSRDSQIYEEVKPTENEDVVVKHRYSAFFQTDLESILNKYCIEDLVITGVMTNLCVESTARDGFYRDYRIFLPPDATTTSNEEMHISSLVTLAYGFACIVSTKDIINLIKDIK